LGSLVIQLFAGERPSSVDQALTCCSIFCKKIVCWKVLCWL